MKNFTIQLKGVYSALFTIYDEQMNVKKNAVHKLMKYHQENGLQGFYVGGNSGEGMVLPVKTRMDMLEAVMEEKRTVPSFLTLVLHCIRGWQKYWSLEVFLGAYGL